MAKYNDLKSMAVDVADALRERGDSVGKVPVQFYGDRIRNIPDYSIGVNVETQAMEQTEQWAINPPLVGCLTSATAQNKVIEVSPEFIQQNGVVHVRFTNQNTATSPILSVTQLGTTTNYYITSDNTPKAFEQLGRPTTAEQFVLDKSTNVAYWINAPYVDNRGDVVVEGVYTYKCATLANDNSKIITAVAPPIDAMFTVRYDNIPDTATIGGITLLVFNDASIGVQYQNEHGELTNISGDQICRTPRNAVYQRISTTTAVLLNAIVVNMRETPENWFPDTEYNFGRSLASNGTLYGKRIVGEFTGIPPLSALINDTASEYPKRIIAFGGNFRQDNGASPIWGVSGGSVGQDPTAFGSVQVVNEQVVFYVSGTQSDANTFTSGAYDVWALYEVV